MGLRGRENGLGRTKRVRVRTDAVFRGLPSHLTRAEICAIGALGLPVFDGSRNRKNLRRSFIPADNECHSLRRIEIHASQS